MPSFSVVLDACALFPASLRDTLLRAAEAGLYRMQLTEEILEEVRRNLVQDKNVPEDKARHLINIIKEQFPESLVTYYQHLISAMSNHEKDRHVLAAAIVCKAQVIVTQNLKDFPKSSIAPFEIEVQSPDEFLVHLFHLDPQRLIKIITEQAEDLRNPPITVSELLDILAQHAPTFVRLIRRELRLDLSALFCDD